MRIGAWYHETGKCEFVVWAPFINELRVKIMSPDERLVSLERDGRGYWRSEVDGVFPGARYLYRLDDGTERPDPASCFQPDGVHGPSQVVDHSSFQREDGDWRGVPLQEMIMYEIHVGTFTKEGTFDAVVPALDYLGGLGVNAIELMPVAQFPGERNWGYDGTYPFAVQNSYGGPDGLRRFVSECHKKGVAVILDVVYNHLGPEGNYLRDFAPYFTDKYKTPWGQAINFDDAYSNDVRNYFIENALHWFNNYQIDALRLDAVHGITDMSAKPFLRELAERVEEFSVLKGRKFYLIAESDLNDSRLTRRNEQGGYGLDAQWNDDFHHCVHTLLAEEKDGYYADFGEVSHLVKSMREGFVYSGGYSEYRKRNHGNSSRDIPAHQFVVFSQNHDQVGNRMLGERLSNLVSFEALKLAAGIVLLSPSIPILFMGEEYGETVPFQYFVSHSDKALIEAVRKGRKDEFASFGWEGEVPDPEAESTFLNSKLNIGLHQEGRHNVLFSFYKELIRLRREFPALSHLSKEDMEARGFEDKKVLFVGRWFEEDGIFCLYNFNKEDVEIGLTLPEGYWSRILDSSSEEWGGKGGKSADKIESDGSRVVLNTRGHSFVLYRLRVPSPLTEEG
ncbi:MAG: malto-oligosyltrehalose trehalohydrolase [Nitrospiraceae bacterium]|nr:MAG: malto-oligosyltrehalose trehalohydrolase [Nitrospiraceae bacterium]